MQRPKGKRIVKVVFGYDRQIYEESGKPVQRTWQKTHLAKNAGTVPSFFRSMMVPLAYHETGMLTRIEVSLAFANAGCSGEAIGMLRLTVSRRRTGHNAINPGG
jgi:hypothetical protein